VKGDAVRTTSAASFRTETLHLLALWAVAVAQPLYDILRRNREFFVAHRAEPLDLVLLALTVSVALPVLVAAAAGALGLVSRRAARAVFLTIVAVLVAATAAQPLAQQTGLAPAWHFVIAGAIGAAGAWLYARVSAVRLFVTLLSPAIVLFPAFLLLHPDMASFVRPGDPTAEAAGRIGGNPPPIVLVVFDQLPLTSLMTEEEEIDAANFPGFAALSRDATWYRNATTVADYTAFAIPPILTGLRPRARHLPTVQDYPQNLFTFLAGAYRFEVFEAITALCPETLCGRERMSPMRRLTAMTLDLSIVYLHLVLPAEQRAELPALTDDWKNFAQGRNWHRRWIAERDDDRRRAPREFVDTISRSDTQPTMYFLHALLPHEPYIYLPSGQQFTDAPQLTGLVRGGHWTREEWAVAEQYRRHLMQLRFVDRLLTTMLDRLKDQDLYDRSLIVVTADHGVSFKPGGSFKTVRGSTLEDVMPVPLFIKAPSQREGTISDLNVESPDIVPTIADLLGVALTWKPDGASARRADGRPSTKTIHHTGARRQYTIPVDDLAARRARAVERKARLFGSGENPVWLPSTAPFRDLIGRPLSSLAVAGESPLQVLVNDSSQFRSVDLRAPTIPAQFTGHVIDARGDPAQAALAIAVNGTIAATTRTYGFLRGRAAATWTALVDPRHFRNGRNDIDILVMQAGEQGVRVERGFTSSDRPDVLNLVSGAAREYWAVKQSGLYDAEGTPLPYRWTNGAAVLMVPMDVDPRPRSLRVGLAHGPGDGPLRVQVNDCTVYEGPVTTAPWYRTFSLRDCPPSELQGSEARITLRSSTRVLQGQSRRNVGVAVETINLLATDWPLPAQRGDSRLDARPAKGADAAHIRGAAAELELVNRGNTVLQSPRESREEGVELELRWSGASASTQRLPLSRTLYPTERLVIEVPLMPPPELEGRGPWTLHVVPVRRDGRPVTLQSPCVVRVVPEG
jgi:hypothetical protein